MRNTTTVSYVLQAHWLAERNIAQGAQADEIMKGLRREVFLENLFTLCGLYYDL